MNPLATLFMVCGILLSLVSTAQSQLEEELNKMALHFTLKPGHQLDDEVAHFFIEEAQKAQFIGLAELHRSEQLSFFTIALLDLLDKVGYDHLAMEIGPYAAKYLRQLSHNPKNIQENIARINKIYGNRLFGSMVPIIFVDREEDALFLKKAAEEGYQLWGLDQEFAYSFEMHLDSIYAYHNHPDEALEDEYRDLKKMIHKKSKKSAFRRKYSHYCKLYEHERLKQFFENISDIPHAKKHINHFYASLDIYCKNVRGENSNQQRADYMKSNFSDYYQNAREDTPKVLVKLGSVHLTRGESPFGVDDMGQYLRKKAEANNTGFLTIRHLRRYKNGRDYVGKKGWKEVSNFMKAGEKKRWTLIDLRPIRAKLKAGELQVTKREKYEIYSYDLLLIPPNDHKARKNF
ncbi:MAG: hypothetical protein R3345_00840 [Fulvivirga sp.]|nr:hypothetical protein [Fulvivirga sp.]